MSSISDILSGPENVPIASDIYGFAKSIAGKIQSGIEKSLPIIPAAREAVEQKSLTPLANFEKANIAELLKPSTSSVSLAGGKLTIRPQTSEEAQRLAGTALGFVGEAEPLKNAIGPTSEVLIQQADSALSKLLNAIKSAGPARAEITAMQSAERSSRIGRAAKILEEVPGERGVFQAKAQLKGPLVAERPRFDTLRAAPEASSIPKELQPLAEEARKYKSAEEFTKKINELFDKISESAFGNGQTKLTTEDKLLRDSFYSYTSRPEIQKFYEKPGNNDLKVLTDFYNQITKATPQAEKLTQSEIDALVTQIQRHPTLTPFEKINTADGLGQLLNGEVPQPHKLSLLEDVFGKDLVQTALSKRSGLDKLKDIGYNLLNLPRSIMASFDFSFGLRQGAFAAPTFRKEFWESWKKQFGVAFSEKAAVNESELIARNPDYMLARESGVSFTKVGSVLADREERYASNWGDVIPIVKQSSRAYTFFANKFRMDIFHSMANDARATGMELEKQPEIAKEIANLVNTMTGRGELPGFLKKSAPILNAAFFSPRLAFSRLQLLNPATYIKADPLVRKQALKSLIGFGGYITTFLTLAHLAGAKVGLDPRSADFGKIRVGNTRFDIAAGFQQYIRMVAQLVTGKYISSTTGKVITLGEGYKPISRLDILARQVESKQAPVFSFITDLLRQQDYAGQPISFKKEIASRFTPLVLQDLYDIAKDNPKLLPWGTLGIFGVGIQTYKQKKRQSPISL